MIDFGLINGFDWDSGNERKSFDKHGISMGEAEQVFFNQPILLLEDVAHSVSNGAWLDNWVLHSLVPIKFFRACYLSTLSSLN